MRDGHLAGPEAVDADLVLEVGELGVEFRGEIARRNDYIVFPLQPLAQRLRDLHSLNRPVSMASAARAPDASSIIRRARGALVRAEGLEPPRFWVTGT